MSREIGIRTRNGRIYFLGISPRSYYDLKSEIKDSEDDINQITSRIKMLAAANPRDIVEEGWSPLEYVNSKISELLSELSEAEWTLCKLYLAKDVLDEWKQGNIVPVEGKPNHYEYDNKGLNPEDTKIFDVLTDMSDSDKYKTELEDTAQEAEILARKLEEERKSWFKNENC